MQMSLDTLSAIVTGILQLAAFTGLSHQPEFWQDGDQVLRLQGGVALCPERWAGRILQIARDQDEAELLHLSQALLHQATSEAVQTGIPSHAVVRGPAVCLVRHMLHSHMDHVVRQPCNGAT